MVSRFSDQQNEQQPSIYKALKKASRQLKTVILGAGQSANNGSQNLRMQLILYPVFFPLKIRISSVLTSIRRIIFWRLD